MHVTRIKKHAFIHSRLWLSFDRLVLSSCLLMDQWWDRAVITEAVLESLDAWPTGSEIFVLNKLAISGLFITVAEVFYEIYFLFLFFKRKLKDYYPYSLLSACTVNLGHTWVLYSLTCRKPTCCTEHHSIHVHTASPFMSHFPHAVIPWALNWYILTFLSQKTIVELFKDNMI